MESRMSYDPSGEEKKFPSNWFWCVFEKSFKKTKKKICIKNFFFLFSNFLSFFHIGFDWKIWRTNISNISINFQTIMKLYAVFITIKWENWPFLEDMLVLCNFLMISRDRFKFFEPKIFKQDSFFEVNEDLIQNWMISHYF